MAAGVVQECSVAQELARSNTAGSSLGRVARAAGAVGNRLVVVGVHQAAGRARPWRCALGPYAGRPRPSCDVRRPRAAPWRRRSRCARHWSTARRGAADLARRMAASAGAGATPTARSARSWARPRASRVEVGLVQAMEAARDRRRPTRRPCRSWRASVVRREFDRQRMLRLWPRGRRSRAGPSHVGRRTLGSAASQ